MKKEFVLNVTLKNQLMNFPKIRVSPWVMGSVVRLVG
jgi:hypothetical protein